MKIQRNTNSQIVLTLTTLDERSLFSILTGDPNSSTIEAQNAFDLSKQFCNFIQKGSVEFSDFLFFFLYNQSIKVGLRVFTDSPIRDCRMYFSAQF